MPYTPIVATLGYVLSPDRQSVLLVHRNARPEDPHQGKWNGLGGKLEPGENVAACMRREIYEESGLHVREMSLRGTISWPGFGRHGEDWFGFIFLITAFEGVSHCQNAEGTLAWQPLNRLLGLELPLWEGDAHFLTLVFDTDPRPFYGLMPYAAGRPISWSFERL